MCIAQSCSSHACASFSFVHNAEQALRSLWSHDLKKYSHKLSLMFHLCLLKLFLQVKEKPPATLDSYVSGSPGHDPGRGDEPSLSVCHKEAGSRLQHGRDRGSVDQCGGQLQQGRGACQVAQGEFQRRLQEGQGERTDRGQKRQEWGSKWEDKPKLEPRP